ncbi:hypothetical protein BSZ19_18465 [Bradyrhizobium japonicum]|uniref:Uncharacterized protein n=1 Tax=Bradyrhizobium japonicum TaxID=375 RepID=A0A1Y2JRZ3_BRAJP|nr:hypothetical protein [Bradyrhizobium japonicum]OSJ32537.1 hypothetical protein BSZ19_18465 [Bradyrhizobium japonicum]
MSAFDITKWKPEGNDIARTVGAFKLVVSHDADADEWGYAIMALGSGYRDGGPCQMIEIEGGWLKRRESAMESAEDSLAVVLGDTLTELGIDGRTYDDGVSMTFDRRVPGKPVAVAADDDYL